MIKMLKKLLNISDTENGRTLAVVASYSRKLNHQMYGGQAFENSDHFCSIKLQIDEKIDPQKAYQDLHEQCQQGVMQSIGNEITGIAGGLHIKIYNAWLDRYLIDGTGQADEYELMSPMQKEVVQAIKRSKKRTKND